jgi:hypothetical protein
MYMEQRKIPLFYNDAANRAPMPTVESPSAEDSALLGDPLIPAGISTSFPTGLAAPATRSLTPSPSADLDCPICGAREMLKLTKAIVRAHQSGITLKDGLESGRYHLHCSLGGEWLVCRQSMEPLDPEKF